LQDFGGDADVLLDDFGELLKGRAGVSQALR
jgi:hypothetical protein